MNKTVYFCPKCKEISNRVEEITFTTRRFFHKNGKVIDECPDFDSDFTKIQCSNCEETL